MAWTVTKLEQYAIGNLYVQHWKLLPDGATYELDTGLGIVRSVTLSPGSATTAIMKAYPNALSGLTAANGYVSVTGVASGDELYLTVYGR